MEGGHIPVKRSSMEQSCNRENTQSDHVGSSGASLDSFDCNSSLSILDLNLLPDARKSVSLVHVDSKSGSIGSWLDQCFPDNEKQDEKWKDKGKMQQLYRSDAFDVEDRSSNSDVFSQSEKPASHGKFLEKFKSPFHTSDDECDNLEFKFDEAELDIDELINEQNEDDQEFHESHNARLSSHQQGDSEKTTTLDFLKSLGLDLTSPAQLPSTNPPGKKMDVVGDSPECKPALDSIYFASASLPMQTINDSTVFEESSFMTKQTFQVADVVDAEDCSDGRPSLKGHPTSTMKAGVFDVDWKCDLPLDFSGINFQAEGEMLQDFVKDEDFAPADTDDAEKLLDQEEEIFEKENKFYLNEDFVVPDNLANSNFSFCRTSSIPVSEDEDGKVSIGAYIAKRSEKLGALEGQANTDRPSFGLKVRTPSPQKPCKLVSNSIESANPYESSTDSALKESGENSSVESSKIFEQLSVLELDETIDPSMITSLSNAISNMSRSLNNEDLARFIIALSNRKIQAQKQEKESSIVPSSSAKGNSSENTVTSTSDSGMCEKEQNADFSNENVGNSTLVNDLDSTLTENGVLPRESETRTLIKHGVQPRTTSDHRVSYNNTFETSELPSLPQKDIFSSKSATSEMLSSTRAHTSLNRGSLSRESIEKLHRKLRVHSDLQEYDNSSKLPDVVSDQSSSSSSPRKESRLPLSDDCARPSLLGTDEEHHINNDVPVTSSIVQIPPLSQSSPESTSASKSNDVNLTRLSAAFEKLHPSMTFDELATIAEKNFVTKLSPTSQRREVDQIDRQVEVNIQSNDERIEISNTPQHELSSSSGIDPILKASSTRGCDDDFTSRRISSSGVNKDSALSFHSSKSSMIPDHSTSFPSYSLANVLPPSMMGHGGYLSNHPMQHSILSNHPMMHLPPQHPTSLGYGRSAPVESGLYNTSHPLSCNNYPPVLSYPSHHVPSVHQIPGRNVVDSCYRADLIDVPHEVMFDETLCVGIPSTAVLPLKNNTVRWVQAEIRLLSVVINQTPAPLNHESYLSLKRKHVISPHSTEHCDVTFTGHTPGLYVVTAEVISGLVSADSGSSATPRQNVTTFNMIANAVTPSVRLLSCLGSQHSHKVDRTLDFGEVVHGSSKSLPIRVLNQSKVKVPVRLVLFVSSKERSVFSLSLCCTPPTREDSESMTILSTELPVSDHPTTAWLHFHSPLRRHNIDHKPGKVEGRIEVVLDTRFPAFSPNISRSQTLLDSSAITAVVGIGKLHAPKSLQCLSFTAIPGTTDVKRFPIKNAGNVTVQVMFAMESYLDMFVLSPSSAVLSPGGDVQMTLQFKPPSDLPSNIPVNQPITNLILMTILPCGPQFEVQVSAVIPRTISHITDQPSPPPNLLANKTCLRWGGVPIGKSQKQNLMLRSEQSSRPTLQFRVSIKADPTSSFKIMAADSVELCSQRDMSIVAGQDLAICIVFAPSQVKMVHAKLEIKTPINELPVTKFTIPLSGYGGGGRITVEGANPRTSLSVPLYNGHIPDSYNLTCRNQLAGFKITNRGTRTSFIKIAVYSDVTFREASSSVFCNPTQFLLGEQQTREIDVRNIRGGDKTSIICVWHGDEISRLLFKSVLLTSSSLIARCVPQSHSYLRLVSFDGQFNGEESLLHDEVANLEANAYDAQIFYLNLKQTLIEVKSSGIDESSSLSSSRSNLTCVDLPERDVGMNLGSKQNSLHQKSAATVPSTAFSPKWELSPTHITVTTNPSEDSRVIAEPVRVRIKNQSLSSLLFDVVWPGHYLTITPNRGRVEAESVTVLLVSPNPSLTSKKDLLPWSGQAMVIATGGGPGGVNVSQSIYIQVKEGRSRSSERAVPSPSTSTEESESEIEPELPKLLISTNPLRFGEVTMGGSTNKHLEFRNMSKSSIRWVLTSPAPAYVKGVAGTSGGIFRSTYAAFVFSHKSGLLEPGARIQVPVSFNPMNAGIYSQHWEIEYHQVSDESARYLQRDRLQLEGQGTTPQAHQQGVTERSSSVRHDIYVSEDCYWFPDTDTNKSSIIKIPIKNRGKVARSVRFINLRPPFYVTHQKHSIRSMCCANLPVTFKPTQPGTFSGCFVVQANQQPDINVTLKAKAV